MTVAANIEGTIKYLFSGYLVHMQRGQVSIEIIVVVIVAATAITVLGFLGQNTADSQRTILVQSQATLLAESVALNLSGLAQLQETATGSTMEIPTKNIQPLNPNYQEKCVITVTPASPPSNDQQANVKLDWEGDGTYDTVISAPTRIPNSFTIPAETRCGDPLMVNKT
jgi:type II secretory pathway pseudopilin PulG